MPQKFVPTEEQRKQVEVGVCHGMSEEAIAEALEISRPTLRLHFVDEISKGRNKRHLRHLMWLEESAEAGNVAAQKAVLQSSTAAVAAAAFEAPDKPQRELKVGKREANLGIAEKAMSDTSGEWGTDLMPEGVVLPPIAATRQ